MKNQPFFIIGSKRGGTTLLRLMLNKNAALAIPPESHFILSLVKYFKDLLKPLTAAELTKAKELAEKGIALDPGPDYRALGHLVLADIYNRQGLYQLEQEELRKAKQL